jgi:hypothetical protein
MDMTFVLLSKNFHEDGLEKKSYQVQKKAKSKEHGMLRKQKKFGNLVDSFNPMAVL